MEKTSSRSLKRWCFSILLNTFQIQFHKNIVSHDYSIPSPISQQTNLRKSLKYITNMITFIILTIVIRNYCLPESIMELLISVLLPISMTLQFFATVSSSNCFTETSVSLPRFTNR